MLLFYQYFQGKKAQAFKSEKIYIPTDVQLQIFFSVSLTFHFSFSLKKILYSESATVLFQHTPFPQ